LVAIFALAVFAQSAFATITANYLGSASFDTAYHPVGYETGYIKPSPNGQDANANVYIGGDQFKVSTATAFTDNNGYFNSWCVDIFQWTANPTSFEVRGKGGQYGLDATRGISRVNDLQKLANEVYSKVDTKEESAAFQEAVWAIMFGAETNGIYQLNTPSEGVLQITNVSNHGSFELATSWLENLDTATATANYDITFLYSQANQDMVVFTAVPEPGTMVLLGFGMLGMAIFGKRRMNKEA
jgi:hypothetical protein